VENWFSVDGYKMTDDYTEFHSEQQEACVL